MNEERGGMRIKICGLTRLCDMEAVNAAKPDYIGFVFAKSRRQVTREQAKALKQRLDPSITAVGVFVNEAPEVIAGLAEEGIIDMIQLHGTEEEAYIRRLQSLSDVPVMKAFSAGNREAVKRACESSADYILLDHGSGGSGHCFDWKMAEGICRPWFLAGGLSLDNIRAALSTGAICLDVSSGVETDGVKDRNKIEACVRICREMEKGEK